MNAEKSVAQRHRVVVIGSGFGGLFACKHLRKADVDITLISKTSTHLFQPLLYQVATGILSVGEIAPATRIVLRKQQNVRVIMGEVTDIDVEGGNVTSRLLNQDYVTPFDSLIVAAGAQQSYFGNDHFATYAPGMKTIDDALELRARILGSFEEAELATDAETRERFMTFCVVGAGPTGVELAGQIAELADRTLDGTFRNIDTRDARVILIEGAGAVLAPMGPKLGSKAQARLEKMGVEIQLNAIVTNVDARGVTVKDPDGTERRIESACKVWSAGVQASGLGKILADKSKGTEVDRAGRVIVEPDLTIKGYPNVFVVGDLMSVPGVPGQAQGAIQGGTYAAKAIKAEVQGKQQVSDRKPFKYFDKGSMATVSRFSAVCQVGKLEFSGFIAWLAWLGLHLWYLVGFRSRFVTVLEWFVSFLGRHRGQMAATEQWVFARLALEALDDPAEAAQLAKQIGAESASGNGKSVANGKPGESTEQRAG
ncbi:NAD(P)/FAD-dependent oxidoreductase [Nocardia seriolae]|uniref:NADH:ubiquinone reductase (non-electrogenic) n=1 Tax=Nocardia seriolae TaxID=37332 RepID=A0A0B8N7H5_9NOCA|nr:NAD(P)/FAD-dependent oxidoreductase [Nocardia seriolae]APA99244.1 NADH dehydrogenase [Nocardia seriolae]MTJ63357.1 NAD(P)/FAD-dependent oxidoreductase [Nocardia seriolae]MTJ70241.1 NAD(P)/FAD-dependent oxidoreductase [Nocardia seriolae]MTJ88840.1 NAD(P)/FAD-dependent oxidoreductase [Nocardia seriolae]MTK32822.1 NAD(P)/FAD-dependent oxidoreductase [Nocardia seriolae]